MICLTTLHGGCWLLSSTFSKVPLSWLLLCGKTCKLFVSKGSTLWLILFSALFAGTLMKLPSWLCKMSQRSSNTESAICFAFHDLQPFMTWHVDFISSWLNLRTTSVNRTCSSGCPSKKSSEVNFSLSSFRFSPEGDRSLFEPLSLAATCAAFNGVLICLDSSSFSRDWSR